MSNEIIGRTSCFNNCPNGRNCFGGYLTETPECYQEIKRVNENLVESFGSDNAHFLPKPKGLEFVVFSEKSIKTFLLDGGKVKEIRKPLKEPINL